MSNKQYRIIRKIASAAITPNGFITVDLPRDYDYEAIGLRINASIQVTTGATSVRAEAPCQLVPRIEIIADGKNNLFSAPFWYTSIGNLRRHLTDNGARALTPPSGFGIATYATEALGVIDFATIDGVRPKDSNFRSRGLSLFQCRFTFGAALDVFVPGAGVAVFSGSPVVDIFAMQCVEDTDDTGNFLTTPIALRKVSYQELALASSNANQEVRLPAGNMIRSVFCRTDGSTTAGEPSSAVLNNLQLANGIDVRYNLAGANVRAKNNADFGAVLTGYYLADFMTQGLAGNNKLSDLWDVSQAAEPKAILDVTGGANVKLQVVTEEYILARAA